MDIDRILENSAHAFEAVARAIQQQGFGLESHSLLMASTVNAGLALEFYAKCLSQLSVGHYPRSHSLQKILGALPSPIQSDLRKTFNASVTNEIGEEIRQIKIQTGTIIDTDFDSVIGNWSRVFVDGRYWFESLENSLKSPLHWFFFDQLVRVLSDTITKQRALQVT